MSTAEIYDYYVLFPNHQEGLRLHKELKEAGVRCTITPTPRKASSCCGISLLIAEENLEAVERIIANCSVQTDGFFKDLRDRPKVWNKFC